MPGKNKTSLLGWHPRSAELEAFLRDEAARRGSLADVLEDAANLYRAQQQAQAAPEELPS